MGKNILKNVLLFLVIFLTLNLIFKSCAGEKEIPAEEQGTIGIQMTNTEYAQGKVVAVDLRNNTDKEITIKNDCPGEPLNVFRYSKGSWEQLSEAPEISCEDQKDYIIASEEKKRIEYTSWNYALFANTGRYKVTLDYEDKTFESNEFTIEEPGVLRLLWTRMLYQPIYNSLVFLADALGKSLGWGIVVLTLILRIILILPSQKGMKQQRRMQLIQPKLAEIKEKHKGDQQRVAQETMALWKEHKVNPFGSCLPLLIQFPILIALFYVIKDGLNPDNIHHLYESLKNIELSELHTNFLGILELTKRNIFWLPLLVGGLQFVQMKLTIGKKKGKEPKKKSEMEAANKVMIYFMPVMIAVFAASLPAGVGLYWGTSTLVGIGQQFFVNKEVDSAGKNEPKVRIKDVKEKN